VVTAVRGSFATLLDSARTWSGPRLTAVLSRVVSLAAVARATFSRALVTRAAVAHTAVSHSPLPQVHAGRPGHNPDRVSDVPHRRGRSAALRRDRELILPADPSAPRRARALLHEAAEEWEVGDELFQDAAMVVTELVANAVDHAGTPSTLTVGMDERGLRVAVRDTRLGPPPRPGPIDPAAARGRGLQMVEALATRWGVTPHPDGKTVWAVLGTG
jgi:anti-sigma regulatory factor (Ser/Thr protein kinase)